jgi:outer membrane receptor for Fe3+-dicitrate
MAIAQVPHPKIDPVKADSRHYTIEFENDKVRVVRIKYGVTEKCDARSSGVNLRFLG